MDKEPNAVVVERLKEGKVWVVKLHRPEQRNAVDGATARKLHKAFVDFETDQSALVAVLHGVGGVFCAGADLGAFASGDRTRANPLEPVSQSHVGLGPMGPTRMELSKPVIAAVEGYAVAGGLELASWCDMRVASESAVFGVFCRRFGVPLIDGGTVRLPRIVGHGRAMDLILTGRPVAAQEALQMGLANRVVPKGQALEAAVELASSLCEFPQLCMRNDRRSAMEQWGASEHTALAVEFGLGTASLVSGGAQEGAQRFKSGQGKGGKFPGSKL